MLQGTSFCNIDCTYCDLSKESRRTKSRMPLDLVLKLIRELIGEALLASEFIVVWHSGEPLTLPPGYYAAMIEAIIDMCEKNAPGVAVSFDFQTNATLIDNAWCDFFRKVRLGY
ncbi:radical SAM protein [Candidatus Competibacter phosphatis]|uniref:radical SAM protein n=1 Tax=Candidatus Competibacter phosphatis TaxID=221280 RepID=UPI0028ACEEA3|nr:radical SAM protein [Candidatus Competibacter phosphatis]